MRAELLQTIGFIIFCICFLVFIHSLVRYPKDSMKIIYRYPDEDAVDLEIITWEKIYHPRYPFNSFFENSFYWRSRHETKKHIAGEVGAMGRVNGSAGEGTG